MFKKKKEVKKEVGEPKKVKLLFSEIPVGSVLFEYNHMDWGIYEYSVVKTLEDFEQPIQTYSFTNIYSHTPISCDVEFYMYVDYNNIKDSGLNTCISLNKYNILDLDYISKVKEVREAKTLKDLKSAVENGLK